MVVACDASAGEEIAAVEQQKYSTHAPDLLLEIWVFIH